MDGRFVYKLLTTLIVAGSAFQLQPAVGAPSAADQAITEFKARKYSQALSGFQRASRSNPGDAICHYYMALCYQYMNQVGLASQEYQWVATNSRDPRLKSQAQAGLSQMGRYQSARSYSGSSPTSSPAASSSSSTATARGGNFTRGKMKVIEFNTKWCHVCKIYDPIFQSVQSQGKYSSSCSFQQLDAEESANADLVQRYQIQAYPTTIFADASGKVIDKFSGSTSAAGLASMLDQSLAQIPK